MIKILTDKKSIAEARKMFETKWKSSSKPGVKLKFSNQSGSDENYAFQIKNKNIFVTFTHDEGYFGHGFGLNPETHRSNSYICQNIFLDNSFNKNRGGALGVDEKGNFYLLHSGNIGGSKKGVGKKLFIKYNKQKQVNTDFGGYYIMAKLNDSPDEIVRQVLNYVTAVNKFKNRVGKETEERKEIPLIESEEDLKINMEYFDKALNRADSRKVGLELVKNGRCFIVSKNENSYNFYPSRFIGYQNNNFKVHSTNELRHGTYTNNRIERILESEFKESQALENEYKRYLKSIGQESQNRTHKFIIWKTDRMAEAINNPDDDAIKDISSFEGKKTMRTHLVRERDHKLAKLAKNKYFKKHKNLKCQICNFDFFEFYGEVGRGFAEAHHTNPVSSMKKGDKTKISDIAIVCSNCHRMLHHKSPIISIKELKKHLKK